MVKENLLHEYLRINCDILTKSHTKCCAHANAEYKIQPHCDKRIMSQTQILCSAIQHTQFAQRETNTAHYTAKKARNSWINLGYSAKFPLPKTEGKKLNSCDISRPQSCCTVSVFKLYLWSENLIIFTKTVLFVMKLAFDSYCRIKPRILQSIFRVLKTCVGVVVSCYENQFYDVQHQSFTPSFSVPWIW